MLRASLVKASAPIGLRHSMATAAAAATSAKKEGDISDAFTSLSGNHRPPLPDRFRALKRDLVRGHETAIQESWVKLLGELRRENDVIAARGPAVIPQVRFDKLEGDLRGLKEEIKKRGTVVVKGVIPEAEARAYKEEIEEYVRKNPSTRGETLDTTTTSE